MHADDAHKLAEQHFATLVAALEAGRSDALVRYLETASRFHTYSFRNQCLIAAQCPTATRVAGYQAWRQLGRWVRRGETGIAILALLVARLTWRSVDSSPPPEATEFGAWMGKWLDPVAQIAHYALYALLVAVPVAGIVLQFARGDALPLFGIAEISSPWLEDRAFAHNVKEVHEILAHALVVLAAFHAAAALIHHCIFRDRTLVRMLPHSEE